MNDPSKFQSVYSNHSKLVYNVCLNYLGSIEDAEEATQDVFIKVHESIERFNEQSSIKTWIYRIAVNICLDRIKARNAKKRFAQIQSLFGIGKTDITPVDFNHPGVKLEDKEAISEIMKAIHALPENQKTAIILKSLEDLSQKEIAVVMEIGEKAVESLLTRAKVNLRRILNETEGK